MWNISGVGFSLFQAGDTRSRQELEHLLGKSFAGVLISDDFSVYNGYGAAAQQKCLAHLLRHFKQVEKLKTPHHSRKPLGNICNIEKPALGLSITTGSGIFDCG
ncbi:mobile element protein [Microcystis aeruginosa NIES-44]|uniref:Mobile element protein n=1 Tax=Microcystis aeruginosa NIES-44 TaxID=449439 RepID=A0A0A1VZY6_MICAE|nr:mobile element protein [Microcystis aeruginosa NIES-44]GAL94826.1 mobile element protein [Microcystis aeruginosa NIES-44]